MSNLLPPQEKRNILRMYRKRVIALALAAVACLGVAGSVLLLPSFLFLRSSGIVLTAKRDTLAGYETSKIADTLANTVTDINGRLNVFPPAEVASPLIAGLIDPILQVQDPTIHISEFDYAPGPTGATAKVTVLGTADTRTDLLAFVDKVKGIGSFTNVSVPIGSFIKETDVSFALSATVTLKE